MYIAALEAANRATDLAIRARQSAEEQIRVLQQLFSRLEQHKESSNSRAKELIQKVIDEEDAVITSRTLNLQRSIEQMLLAVVTEERGLASKEDHDLAEGINQLLSEFDSIDRKVAELKRLYHADRESYQQLLNKLNDAIRDAESAISTAAITCSHPDAGSSGNFSLSSARSSKPSQATWGVKRSEIKSRIESAKQAKSYADDAYSQANSAIAAAEAAREAARQAELAREREERRREREAARERAAAREAIERSQSSSRRAF